MFCFHWRSDALAFQGLDSFSFGLIGLRLVFKRNWKKEVDRYWIWFLDTETLLVFLRIGSGLILFMYQSTSETKVVWMSMLHNGIFALFMRYGYYCKIRR